MNIIYSDQVVTRLQNSKDLFLMAQLLHGFDRWNFITLNINLLDELVWLSSNMKSSKELDAVADIGDRT
jgi:hypothetical protein